MMWNVIIFIVIEQYLGSSIFLRIFFCSHCICSCQSPSESEACYLYHPTPRNSLCSPMIAYTSKRYPALKEGYPVQNTGDVWTPPRSANEAQYIIHNVYSYYFYKANVRCINIVLHNAHKPLLPARLALLGKLLTSCACCMLCHWCLF
jgi:hypothetical protein